MSFKVPAYSSDLIRALDQRFPHRCAPKGASLEDIHRDAGRRELIDFLLSCIKDGEDNLLSTPNV